MSFVDLARGTALGSQGKYEGELGALVLESSRRQHALFPKSSEADAERDVTMALDLMRRIAETSMLTTEFQTCKNLLDVLEAEPHASEKWTAAFTGLTKIIEGRVPEDTWRSKDGAQRLVQALIFLKQVRSERKAAAAAASAAKLHMHHFHHGSFMGSRSRSRSRSTSPERPERPISDKGLKKIASLLRTMRL
jgi:hypothetical protein